MTHYQYELIHQFHEMKEDEILDNGGVLPCSQLFLSQPSEFAQRALLYLSSAGNYVCDRDYLVRRAHFPYFYLVCVDEGYLYVRYDGAEFCVSAGELLLMDCARPH